MGVYLDSHRVKLNRAIELRTDDSVLDSIIDRTISVYENPIISEIGGYAFRNCSALTSVSLPKVASIADYTFYSCSSLASINLPQATSIGNYAFYGCGSLTSINLPQATSIGNYAFYSCSHLASINLPQVTLIGSDAFGYCDYRSLTSINLPQATLIGDNAFSCCWYLTSINLPQVTSIGSYAFRNCYKLLSLYLLGSSIVSLAATNVFIKTPISTYTTSTSGVYGSIFVPASLYSSYLTAKNWSIYSARIVSR